MGKKLYRNTQEGALSGVCSGLGEYWELDKTWVRLAFILSVVFSSFLGLGLLGPVVYIILWVVIPPKPFVYRQEGQSSFYDVDYRVQDDYRAGADYADSGYGASGYSDTDAGYAVSDNMYYTGPEYGGGKPNPVKRTKRDRTVAGLILLSVGLFFLLYQLDVFYWVELMQYWPVILIISGIAVIYGSFSEGSVSTHEHPAANEADIKVEDEQASDYTDDSFTDNAEKL